MKIAFLTPEFPHQRTGTSGGIGTSIKNLASGLLALGHDIVLLVYGQPSDETYTDGGITFHLIKNVKLTGLSAFLTQKKIQNKIDRLYDSGLIDIVEAPDWTGIAAFINTKCPLVLRLHGSDTYFCHLEKRPVKFLNRFREKRAFRHADAIVSVSRYTAEVTKSIFGTSRTFSVIPNGIDTADFSVSESGSEVNILYFGTLIRKKGMLELPAIFNLAYRKNKNARLIIAGKDSSDIATGNPSTWALMQPLFDSDAFKNVVYLGAIPHTEVKSLIATAAVCVFPSFAEALPVSWIEAMAMGKPVVASNVGWAKEIITDGDNGFLAYPEDHVKFANKIAELLESAELRFSIGSRARKRSKDFDILKIASANLIFYESTINCHKSKTT